MSFAAVDAAEPGPIFRTLAAELFGAFGIDSVHVCVLADGDTVGHGTVYEQSPGGPARERDHYVVPFDRPSGVHHVLATGAPLNVFDAPNSEIVSGELTERFNVASMLYVPLSYERSVRAVVMLLSSSPRRFAGEEVDLVHTMANQAAGGLAALDLRTRLSAQAETQAAIARAARTLNESLERPEVLDTLCREVNVALGADLSGVYLGDAENGGVAVAAQGLTDGDSDWWGYRIAPGEGVAGQVLADRRAGGVERLPARGRRAGRGGDALRAHRRVRAHVLERDAARRALGRLLLRAAGGGRGPDHAPGDRQPRVRGLRQGRGVRGAPGPPPAPTRSPACSTTAPCRCAPPRRSGGPGAAGRGSPACSPTSTTSSPSTTATGTWWETRSSSGWPPRWTPSSGPTTAWPATAATSSWCCCPTPTRRAASWRPRRLRTCVARTGLAFGDLGLPVTASVGIAQWAEPLTAGELLDRADRALLLAKRRGKDSLVVASAHAELELAALETRQRALASS